MAKESEQARKTDDELKQQFDKLRKQGAKKVKDIEKKAEEISKKETAMRAGWDWESDLTVSRRMGKGRQEITEYSLPEDPMKPGEIQRGDDRYSAVTAWMNHYIRQEASKREALWGIVDQQAAVLSKIQDVETKKELFAQLSDHKFNYGFGWKVEFSESSRAFLKLSSEDQSRLFSDLTDDQQDVVIGHFVQGKDSPEDRSSLWKSINPEAIVRKLPNVNMSQELWAHVKDHPRRDEILQGALESERVGVRASISDVIKNKLLNRDEKVELLKDLIDIKNKHSIVGTETIPATQHELYSDALSKSVAERAATRGYIEALSRHSASETGNKEFIKSAASSIISELKEKDISGKFSEITSEQQKKLEQSFEKSLKKATQKSWASRVFGAIGSLVRRRGEGVNIDSRVDKELAVIKKALRQATKKLASQRSLEPGRGGAKKPSGRGV